MPSKTDGAHKPRDSPETHFYLSDHANCVSYHQSIQYAVRKATSSVANAP